MGPLVVQQTHICKSFTMLRWWGLNLGHVSRRLALQPLSYKAADCQRDSNSALGQRKMNKKADSRTEYSLSQQENVTTSPGGADPHPICTVTTRKCHNKPWQARKADPDPISHTVFLSKMPQQGLRVRVSPGEFCSDHNIACIPVHLHHKN